MRLKQLFSSNKIKEEIKQKKADFLEVVELNLRRAGEEFVNLARTNGSYTDQTGNLRSSVGYMLFYDGKVISWAGFETVKDGGKGAKLGKAFARLMGQNNKKGFTLVGVAGMEYAAAVESRGFDVITGSGQTVDILLKEALTRVSNKA